MSTLDELYMQRRLQLVSRAQDLSPSMQFDLASSGLTNAELDEAVSHFNPKPEKEGWGFASVFEELLSREPRKVPVEDLATLQSNLKEQGYLPPDHPADGTWGPDSYAAFNQLDRDNGDQVRQGNHLQGGTIQDGIRFFGSMLPRSVIQGVIGTAKGLVEQAPETLERGGALGGAAVGAGLGATVGSVVPGFGTAVGAGVGAAVGSVAGFLSSLWGGDDDESVLDALHPFNQDEWTTSRNFFEDVGFVASAASLVRGGRLAVGGAKALTSSTLRGSLTRLDPVTKPGFVMNMLGSARGSAVLGAFAGGAHGLAAGDDFGDMFEEALAGGAIGFAVGASPVGRKMRDFAASYGLKRIQTNPVVSGINDVFTGGVIANVGGRYAGGLGSGEKTTAIEQNIKDAPVVLPEWADAIGSMVLLPKRITPLGLGEIGRAAQKSVGDNRLWPYFHALETARDAAGRVLPKRQVNQTLDMLRDDPVPDLWTREQFGVHQLTKWSLESRKAEEGAEWFARGDIEAVYGQAKNEVWAWYKAGDMAEQEGKKNLLMSLSNEEPHEYANYLVRLEARGSGFREWPRYEPAQVQAERLALAARRGDLEFRVAGADVSSLDAQIARTESDLARLRELPSRGRNVPIVESAAERNALTQRARKLQEEALPIQQRAMETGDQALYEQARKMTDEADELYRRVRTTRTEQGASPKQLTALEERLEKLRLRRSAVKTKEETNFVATDPRYMTQKDWSDAADHYVSLVESLKRAGQAADSVAGDVARAQQAQSTGASALAIRDELDTFVRSFSDPMNHHRRVPQSLLDTALDARTTKHYKVDPATGKRKLDKTTYQFADFLKEKAAHAGADVELANPELAQTILDNGYKLVATGDEMRFLGEVRELAQVHNVGDYTKRTAFFEAAGLSPFKATEKEIGILKQAHMEGNLNQAMNDLGLPVPGEVATRALVDKMHAVNNRGFKKGPFSFSKETDLPLIKDARLLMVDLRQLKLDDIVDALKLDEGLTKVDDHLRAAQRIKDAIHKGSVFGGEVSVRHPFDSLRMLASATRVEGLTGFSDWMRQLHVINPPRALTVAGGVVGAGVGAQEEGLEGALKGAAYGALALGSVGYGGKYALAKWPSKSPFKPGTYGWLPNNLHNAAMALRYSLSFTFDLGRRMEQAQIASAKHGLPVVLAPKSWARRHLAEDFGGDVDGVMPGLRAQLDEVMGSKSAMNADDMDRRAAAVGLTGFSQRDADAVYAHLMIKGGKMNTFQVRDAVHELGHYPARAGAERSLNFVMFPFSFSKKMLNTLGDFMIAEPARAFLVQEGMRQWYEVRNNESMSEKWGEFTDKYLPLASELGRLNNLSYGISPGRFFMEGLSNNKTLTGKIAQSLAAVFTPSGAVTPLQQAAGKAGDQMVNLFSPIFLTGEDTENFISIFTDFAPAVRDVRNLVIGAGENQPSVLQQQLTAVTERQGGAPWYQLRHFSDERRAIKAEYEDLASSFGYTTVDGFLNSDVGGTFKADVEQRTLALVDKYPTGAKKSQTFETSTLMDDKQKAELIADPNRSPAEEMIVQLIEMENEGQFMAETLGMTDEEILPSLTEDIRALATKWYDDVRFRELYDRWFKYRYGPVAEVFVG